MSTKILVADDVASARLLYRTVLTSEGFEVIEASHGEEALLLIESDRPDLVILDIGMPRIDGLQVLERMKALSHRPPTIVTTAHKERSTVLAAAHQGIASYMTKPINIADLRSRVLKVLNRPAEELAQDLPPKPSTRIATEELTVMQANRFDLLDPQLLKDQETHQMMTVLDLIVSLSDDADGDSDEFRQNLERTPLIKLKEMGLAMAKRTPHKKLKQVIPRAFKQGNTQVKALAVALLPRTWSAREQVALLEDWIEIRDGRLRELILDRVKLVKNKRAVHLVTQCLEDQLQSVRDRALKVLQSFRLEDVVVPVLESYRKSGIELPPSFQRLFFHGNHDLVKDVLKMWMKKSSAEDRVYLAACISRNHWMPGHDFLVKFLEDKDAQVRVAALKAMGRQQLDVFSRLVIARCGDSHPQVRKTALKVLESFPVKELTKALIDALLQSSEFLPSSPELVFDAESDRSIISRLLEQEQGQSATPLDHLPALIQKIQGHQDKFFPIFEKTRLAVGKERGDGLKALMLMLE